MPRRAIQQFEISEALTYRYPRLQGEGRWKAREIVRNANRSISVVGGREQKGSRKSNESSIWKIMFQNAERKGMELSPQIGQFNVIGLDANVSNSHNSRWIEADLGFLGEKSHKIFDMRSRLIKHLLFHSQYKSHGCTVSLMRFFVMIRYL